MVEPEHVRYVPRTYRCRRHDRFGLHHHPDEADDVVARTEEDVSFACVWLRDALDFRPVRSLHVCLYHSHEEAVSSLRRDVPGNMAMAPFSTEEASLIVIQSPACHPMNGDRTRMRRLLVHELCHVFVREKTGSVAMLGDDLRDLRIRPWLDEGLAEVLSRRAVGRESPCPGSGTGDEDWSLEEIDRHLCDLGSARRSEAFARAEQRVRDVTLHAGARWVFEHLVDVSDADHESGEQRGPLGISRREAARSRSRLRRPVPPPSAASR